MIGTVNADVLYKKIEKIVKTSQDMKKLNSMVLKAYGLNSEFCREIENY